LAVAEVLALFLIIEVHVITRILGRERTAQPQGILDIDKVGSKARNINGRLVLNRHRRNKVGASLLV
jgi:hypothetical protein